MQSELWSAGGLRDLEWDMADNPLSWRQEHSLTDSTLSIQFDISIFGLIRIWNPAGQQTLPQTLEEQGNLKQMQTGWIK